MATSDNFEQEFRRREKHREKILNINNYIDDGFEKICDVVDCCGKWKYKNINQELMFSPHNSWVYFIVENKTIVKCGETGLPLGIKETGWHYMWETQPVSNTKSRLGRIRGGDGTDYFIRNELQASIRAGNNVSIWAKKCPLRKINESIGGVIQPVTTSIHKNLEKLYLEYFTLETGYLPKLNKETK